MRFFSLILVAAIAACQPSEDMGAPQSPSATPTFPATITPPVNGENLDATALNVNVETPLQNGVEAARLLTYGGGLRRRVACTSNTVMVIQPLGAVVAVVAGVNTVVPWTSGPATINPTALAGGALAASTRYWVYATAVLSTGIPVFVVSTNAPDEGLKYSSASFEQMYVSTFYTDGSSNILTYTQSDNVFNYSTFTGSTVGGNVALWNGAAVVATTVAIGASVPSQAVATSLRVSLSSGVDQLTQIAAVGGVGSLGEWAQYVPGAGIYMYYTLPWSLGLGTSFAYVNNDASARTRVLIEGFTL